MFNTDYNDLNRYKSVNRLCPQLFNKKKILYIGASKLRFQFLEEMKLCDVDVIEAFSENCEYLKTIETVKNVYLADITDFNITETYDYIIWHHGPEHVKQELIPNILTKLENSSREGVVLGCPNGFYEQEESYGNRYEKHLSHLYCDFFNKLGYVTESLGEIDKIGSGITAVKFKESYLPWFTYKANTYIHRYLSRNHNCKIFEFGCGRSTVWFNQFTNDIISIEHDLEWAKKIQGLCSADIRLINRPYADIIKSQNRLFDVISVDGRDRVLCIKNSVEKLAKNGMFILDNSDRTAYTEGVVLLNAKFGQGIKFTNGWETTIWEN